MNDDLNQAYARTSRNGGCLSMPVLFLHGRYDYTCETMNSRLAQPMRAYCERLSETVIDSGHWMAQEKPNELNRELAAWMAGLPH